MAGDKETKKDFVTVDGNEAAALVAYKLSEVIAIYPITPSSTMGELADEWASKGKKNILGTTPMIQEMQSEGGAAGAVHGALQMGSLTTTFTASQGLLLMEPNLYKIAGELTPDVIHVAARSIAAQGLSIFGDHQDIYAMRPTGWGMLASSSVQEAQDMAMIAHAATLKSRVPMIHFFDGFRTSHEVNKIERLSDEDIKALFDFDLVLAHRGRALSNERPYMRGTAQNPDVYFQAREAANPYYEAAPGIVQETMDKFAARVGRRYNLFDYTGAPDAQRVAVVMGSGAETAEETVKYLNEHGEKVGVLKVRLYRPFAADKLVAALPQTVEQIAVLDRTKEPGSGGEPLYKDVALALSEAYNNGDLESLPKTVGGRYGLSSKEFTPAMVKSVFDNLSDEKPKNHFTVGINDDVTHTSLEVDPQFNIDKSDIVKCLFYGLGSDGTVGANKNSIKIIGEGTDLYTQGYFVYDSKKSGSTTVSHLRFGPEPIKAPYLVDKADFVACHQFGFLEKFNMLEKAREGATFLLNSPYGADEVWDKLPRTVQQEIIDKKLKFFVIDGNKVARDTGMKNRVNTIMQTSFFALSGVLPRDKAIAEIKKAIKKTYSKKGENVVNANYAAVDAALGNLHEVKVPGKASSEHDMRPAVPANAPDFVKNVTAAMIAGLGDELPVSALPVDGTYPTGTTQYEKRNIATDIPEWKMPEACAQCNKCVLVCPHAAIRAKVFDPASLDFAPETFKSIPAKGKPFEAMQYALQVSPEDCTGCGICIEACPVIIDKGTGEKPIRMVPQQDLKDGEIKNWDFFRNEIPEADRKKLVLPMVKSTQFLEPLFEFSGACGGCGETPYLKLISQLFGDRALIANATGCSSIYGGNLPTTPWSRNSEGRGPAWSNSLFEDNAEFGLGFRLSIDKQTEMAYELLDVLKVNLGKKLVEDLMNADQSTEEGIQQQRARVELLKSKLELIGNEKSKNLLSLADSLIKKSVWLIGGDGWAYDIGYGGLNHVLAQGRDINTFVLDTEVYSNTGGQSSKSTPRGAVAKFAASGKKQSKTDLGDLAIAHKDVYVARIAMGADDAHTVKTILEAESYDGPSLVVAYAHCIAQGLPDMKYGLEQQKKAVLSGHWPLFRYDPRRIEEGKNPFQLDSKAPSIPLEDYIYNETRYSQLTKTDPEEAARLLQQAKEDVDRRWKHYQQLAA